MSKRYNWQEFKRVLDAHGITRLYHFTDSRNLPSIERSGCLLSLREIGQQNIRPFTGGSDQSHSLDRGLNLDNYVRLSFVKDHPMMYVAQNDGRISSPKVLEISTDVIFEEGVKFTDCNAARTSKGFEIGDGIDFFRNKIHFDLFHKSYFDTERSPYYQAEVLVPKSVSLRYVLNRSELGLRYTPEPTAEERAAAAERQRQMEKIRREAEERRRREEEQRRREAAINWAKNSIKFLATHPVIRKGGEQKTLLRWSTIPEEFKTYIDGIGLYEGETRIGSRVVSPTDSTKYTLKINVAGEMVEHTAEVRVEPEAIIHSFTCDRAKALPGTKVNLNWEVENAQWFSLNSHFCTGNSWEQEVTEDTTFTLHARDSFGGKRQSLQVHVLPQETIDKISHSLRTSPKRLRQGKNENAVIRWDARTGDPGFAVSARLSDSHGQTLSTAEFGSLTVSPRDSETYTLNVSIEGRQLPAQSVTVDVLPEAVVMFESDLEYVDSGGEVTLTWNVKNAGRVTLDGKAKAASGSEKVRVETDTSFNLRVTDGFGTKAHIVRVSALAKPAVKVVKNPETVINTFSQSTKRQKAKEVQTPETVINANHRKKRTSFPHSKVDGNRNRVTAFLIDLLWVGCLLWIDNGVLTFWTILGVVISLATLTASYVIDCKLTFLKDVYGDERKEEIKSMNRTYVIAIIANLSWWVPVCWLRLYAD